MLEHHGEKRRIELYWGDLANLPSEHAVDLLVVSAFRNDYMPTPTSLIGALHQNRISVYGLSLVKQRDLREEFGCWLCPPVGMSNFGRILCIESGWHGTPPEMADNLFRAIVPISLSNVSTRSVAMPLIDAGDQGYVAGQMLEAVLLAAVGWVRRGMPVEVLKIVAYSAESAEQSKREFLKIREADATRQQRDAQWDVFISHSSSDAPAADHIQHVLSESRAEIMVFRDRESLAPGASWIMAR